MIDESLLDFCITERQKQYVRAKIEYATNVEAAESLGITRRSLQKSLQQIKLNAARRGWSPKNDMHHPVPEGFVAKGVSTLYDDEGNVKVQWVKSNIQQQDQLEQIRNALDEFLEHQKNKSPFIAKPKKKVKANELAVVNIGDAHFGMYAHEDISGENYNLEIAAKRHKDVFMRLMNNAPECETIIINQLGDFFHSDNYESTTTKGTRVDTDGRLEQVFLVGLEVLSFITEEALKRYKNVIVRHVKGNHDSVLSMAIKAHQEAYFRNNKRVTIQMTPSPTWVYQHGNTAFLVSHGHAPKPAKLAEYFAAKYPEIWGNTKHRYCYHGHIHSKNATIETYGGCITESFAGLPSADTWHNESGYVSGQSMCLIVLDKEKGEVRRSTERL